MNTYILISVIFSIIWVVGLFGYFLYPYLLDYVYKIVAFNELLKKMDITLETYNNLEDSTKEAIIRIVEQAVGEYKG